MALKCVIQSSKKRKQSKMAYTILQYRSRSSINNDNFDKALIKANNKD